MPRGYDGRKGGLVGEGVSRRLRESGVAGKEWKSAGGLRGRKTARDSMNVFRRAGTAGHGAGPQSARLFGFNFFFLSLALHYGGITPLTPAVTTTHCSLVCRVPSQVLSLPRRFLPNSWGKLPPSSFNAPKARARAKTRRFQG